jgi:NAD(P)-dependent dehydrogenase (short-subunit alcohol dehydrogenase family)
MTKSSKTPNGRLAEKTTVITGGATGMGWASALMFVINIKNLLCVRSTVIRLLF